MEPHFIRPLFGAAVQVVALVYCIAWGVYDNHVLKAKIAQDAETCKTAPLGEWVVYERAIVPPAPSNTMKAVPPMGVL